MSSILEAIKTYMLDFPLLEDGSPLFSDHSVGTAVQYSIIQIPGTRVLEEDLVGNQDCQYTFAFQSIESTMDELQRFANANFYDELEVWLRTQSKLNLLPVLDANQKPELIETLGWGYLMQEETGIGVYQVQCRLLYIQEP
jgi:hypothetical protein